MQNNRGAMSVVLAGLVICFVFFFARWRAHRHHLARQAEYNRAMEEIERHWPGTETLRQGLGPKTTVHIDKKMKQ
jgi:hypothetical protein